MRVALFILAAIIGAWSGSATADYAAAQKASGEKDYAAAFAACHDDAVKGERQCQSSIGYMYANGLGVKKDPAEAVKWYRLAADQGDMIAQYNMGLAYHNGDGLPKDDTEAVKWFTKSANQGNVPAQNSLGVHHQLGWGVKQDYIEAVKWYRLAANQGSAVAQANIGDCYARGIGVAKDDAEAAKWYRLAANQRNAQGQNGLGFMYQYGRGIEKNYEEAVKWYRLAADQGYVFAQGNLAYMYANGWGVLQDYTEAVKWYRLAAEQGNSIAENAMAIFYRNGWGVEQSYQQEIFWRLRSANHGNGIARAALSSNYQVGQGVDKDEIEALSWLILAEKSTDGVTDEQRPMLRKSREDLQAKMSAADIQSAEKRAANWKPVLPTQTQQYTAGPQAVADAKPIAQEPAQKEKVASVQPRDVPSKTSLGNANKNEVATQGSRTLKTFALVIGNSAYPTASLPNPRADAQSVARLLESLGVKVDLVIDANRKKFVDALSKFADKSVGADLTILYYAGHGVQYNGINYLIPVDTDLNTTASTFTLEAIPLNLILDQYLPANTRIVMLDACRDNPLSRSLARTRGISTGLAPISVASGTLISYATKDGSVAIDGIGVHSPYTAALLAHLSDPVDINIVLRRVRSRVLDATNKKQEPWEYGSLIGDELVLATMVKK